MCLFKIGDRVTIIPNSEYTLTTGGQTGTIYRTNESFAWIEWEGFPQHDSKQWEIRLEYLRPIENLSTEEKVARKCKYLWNNSKFVKNNPSLSY